MDTQQPVPYILFNFGKGNLMPGDSLAAEGHLFFLGREGSVRIHMSIDGRLDKDNWKESPPPSRVASGYWTFPQSLSLTHGGQFCQNGTYWMYFECIFDGSHHSAWEGRVQMTVSQSEGGPKLVINSGDHSLVNLNGVDLRKFSLIQIQTSGNALVNVQAMLEALQAEAAANPDVSKQFEMIPVQLRRKDPPAAPKPPCSAARFDLSNGRRIVLFAQEELILGRNRPDPHAHLDRTDVAIRILPRSEQNDAISKKISRQHLRLVVEKGRVELHDPRDDTHKSAKPATWNGDPLPLAPVELIPERRYHYKTVLGQDERIGFDVFAFHDNRSAEFLQGLLSQIAKTGSSTTWRRESSCYDALLIERSGFSDDYNGREAYLMLMGAVLIGSSPHCAIQIHGPGVQPEHAALVHWDGQFRLTPWGRAPLLCDGNAIHFGDLIVLTPRENHTLHFGETAVHFRPRAQLGLDP